MVDWVKNALVEWLSFSETFVNETWYVEYGIRGAIVLFAIILAVMANVIAKRVIVRLVKKIIERTATEKDDLLLRRRVFTKLSHLAPALVIYAMAVPAFEGSEAAITFVQKTSMVYMLFAGLLVIDSLFNAGLDIYNTLEVSRNFPIKSFVQVAKIVLYFVGALFAISICTGKEMGLFLGGLGAMTAVLMLIFKDSILGFVAGIQLSANRMVSPGDWIEMPAYGADGDVLEISLTTVKVQNWDKTISTVPTYALITSSFKNWRGMTESSGRRIKRSLALDMNSVKFCDEEMIERFSRIQYISEYVEKKKAEIDAHNEERKVDNASLVNGRRLTNLGTFRAYVEAYLRNHPLINRDMTFLVRQLPPSDRGIPIEIYVFSSDKRWANYEAIQADIFDHLLAIIPEFDLRVYQLPSGGDASARAAAVAD